MFYWVFFGLQFAHDVVRRQHYLKFGSGAHEVVEPFVAKDGFLELPVSSGYFHAENGGIEYQFSNASFDKGDSSTIASQKLL